MGSNDETDGPQTYEFGPGTKVTVIAPDVCKNGHTMGPGQGTVGWSTPHIVYTCNRCSDEGRPNHTIYLLPPSNEELLFYQAATSWCTGSARRCSAGLAAATGTALG